MKRFVLLCVVLVPGLTDTMAAGSDEAPSHFYATVFFRDQVELADACVLVVRAAE